MKYRVGQRVRIIRADFFFEFVGKEATISGPSPFLPGVDVWLLDVDGRGTMTGHQYHTFEAYKLAPLSDPAADAFLARMKKLGSEPINEAPKVTERIAK